jgi:hypothetical protein
MLAAARIQRVISTLATEQPTGHQTLNMSAIPAIPTWFDKRGCKRYIRVIV